MDKLSLGVAGTGVIAVVFDVADDSVYQLLS